MAVASFEWFVARRYLTAPRRQAFISLISIVSVLGVGIGVMAVIIALALMTGVQREMRDRIVGSTAHVYVLKIGPFGPMDQELAPMRVDGVTGAAPAILGGGLVTTERGGSEYVMLKGVDPALEPAVTDITAAMRTGSLDDLQNREDDTGIVLGDALARTLGVTLGDEVLVITPQAVASPTGMLLRRRMMKIVGTFQFGFHEVDSAYAFLSLPAAQSLLGGDGPDRIQLRLADLGDTARVHQTLVDRLGNGYLVSDWMELNKPLYSALWLEKMAISLTIGLIVMVAALNIVASLVLLVMEKSRDIAILRTMGAPARAVRRIFVLQGLTIGLVGTIGGTVLGLAACWFLEQYQLISLDADVYQIAHLRFLVLPLDVAVVVGAAILICYVATLYPARQAGRLDPAEALRNQ